MMRVVLFFALRYQWALALWVVRVLVRMGMPSWAVNLVGAIFGTGWAYTALRWTGWHPQMVVDYYERQRRDGLGTL